MKRLSPWDLGRGVGLCVALGLGGVWAHAAAVPGGSAERATHIHPAPPEAAPAAETEPAPEPERALEPSVAASVVEAAAEAPVRTPLVPLDLPDIDALIERAIRIGKMPGAVVLVGRRDGIVFRRAYGDRARIPERVPMTPDTIFDLASLSKPLVVGTLAQWLIETGKLRLSDRVAHHLPEFGVRGKSELTVEQLLLHTSGLPPINTLYDYRHGPERAFELTMRTWPEALPNLRFIYSDVGYIALGAMIERITGEQLERTAERVIWGPLGMKDTRFCRELCDDPRIAPTELNYGWKRSPIRGEVSDPRAYRLGGVAGNAGVFSTVDDLARFARMLLGGGELEGARILSAQAVKEFTEPRAVPGGARTLGWDSSTGFSTPRGRLLSDRAYGHGGSTGTSLWIDPELDLFIVFLSNRTHPHGGGRVLDLQGAVADAAATALGTEDLVQAASASDGTRPHASIPNALPITGG